MCSCNITESSNIGSVASIKKLPECNEDNSKSRRVGGTTYQVPVEIRPARQLAMALRWMSQYASARRGMPMPKAVAAELLEAYKGEGNVIKKRDDTHRMAQANKAFAHYAW